MDYTYLGRTGLKVSRVCLGTMNFGKVAPEDDAVKIMDRALELGINFFDTANTYPGADCKGRTEEILGRWFAQDKGRRQRVVLCTKVYSETQDGSWPNTGRLSAYHIRQACEDSLRRLQTDHIDLYQFHHIDRFTPWEEIWQAAEVLVQQGKVIYFGSSIFAGWHIVQAQEAAFARSFVGLVSEQCKYSLTTRQPEMELLPACEDYGLGVIPWSPLGGGLLGGALQKHTEGRRSSEGMARQVEAHRNQLERYEKLAGDIHVPPGRLALAWLEHQEAVTAPIIGPRTLEQLEDAAASVEVELDDTTLNTLDQIWPGPGKPAPECWAW